MAIICVEEITLPPRSLHNALFQDQVGIDSCFACGDDGIGGSGEVVETEPFDRAQFNLAAFVLANHFTVFVPDRGFWSVHVDGLHHAGRMIYERVEREKFQDRVQDHRDAMSVCPDDPLGVRIGGKIAVGQDDFVTMPHAH